MKRYLTDALEDDWGVNALEEIIRHLDPVLADLRRGERTEAATKRVSALGAQLQAARSNGLMRMTNDLDSEIQVFMPLLERHSSDLRA